MPGYSQAALEDELSGGRVMVGETPPTEDLAIELPDDSNNGWLGLAWILVAMVPLAIGGGILQPAINSLITKRVGMLEVGVDAGYFRRLSQCGQCHGSPDRRCSISRHFSHAHPLSSVAFW